MQFRNISIHPLLKGYIEKMWLFESDGRASSDDIKLIVPNGRIKIAVPYRNGIIADANKSPHITKEHSITLVGIFDKPSTMDIAANESSGTICAEFSPGGAYRFFRLPLSDIKNGFFSLTEILGRMAKQLQEEMANAETTDKKACLFQQFLLKQFLQYTDDTIFQYCVEKITSSKGTITIKELEKKTGYSSRWLNMKFIERLGVSPKNLASIIRFRHYYETLCGNQKLFVRNDFYHYYYDQSHFIKDFKRFTGLTPTGLENKINDFGKVFYNV